MMHIEFADNFLRGLLFGLSQKDRSRVFENVLRYYIFCYSSAFGAEKALELLDEYRQLPQFTELVGSEADGINIYCGVKSELEFYRTFMVKLKLVPTLDAGCAFDMVGQLKQCFLCIDVTRNIRNKSSAENMNVPLGWKKLFAETKGKSTQFYDENCDRCGKPKMTAKCPKEILRKKFSYDIEFFVVRHIWINYIEFNRPICLAVKGLLPTNSIRKSQVTRLVAHLQFYLTYREKLKLVPALSCDDCTDFVGETNGKMVRYLVLEDTNGYNDKYVGFLKEMSDAGIFYEVAVYSCMEQIFSFYNCN